MTLTIYNTLTRTKEPFETVEPNRVRMYVCGPTVYDSAHIGHARAVVTFDVIVRYLRTRGYEVTYVRNFTDVDDKIIQKANQTGASCQEIAERYIDEFHRDMDALYVERPTIEPRATEFIDDIIRIVERLIAGGFAYVVDGDVYFSVEAFSEYGKLSNRRLDQMEAGARVDVDDRKRNPFDFALWKSSKPEEPWWESPWGRGRPGWHIECSAMSSSLLGETIDIHGGGIDLIFPHHENEIAQSEAAFGKTFVRYWMHNGFVNINNEKMSKSLKNFRTVRSVLDTYHPETIRMFLISSHYRSPIDFTENNMEEAESGVERIYATLQRLETTLKTSAPSQTLPRGETWERFCEVMDDDFNTAKAVGILFDTVRSLNRILDEHSEQLADAVRDLLEVQWGDVLAICGILGVMNEPPADYFERKKQDVLEKKGVDTVLIEEKIAERREARKAKQWQQADAIRKELEAMGVSLEDRPDGTTKWRLIRG
ncbi:MAG: cysteine--tRNA ligase [Thermodesulfobacteriota bacterium]